MDKLNILMLLSGEHEASLPLISNNKQYTGLLLWKFISFIKGSVFVCISLFFSFKLVRVFFNPLRMKLLS